MTQFLNDSSRAVVLVNRLLLAAKSRRLLPKYDDVGQLSRCYLCICLLTLLADKPSRPIRVHLYVVADLIVLNVREHSFLYFWKVCVRGLIYICGHASSCVNSRLGNDIADRLKSLLHVYTMRLSQRSTIAACKQLHSATPATATVSDWMVLVSLALFAVHLVAYAHDAGRL